MGEAAQRDRPLFLEVAEMMAWVLNATPFLSFLNLFSFPPHTSVLSAFYTAGLRQGLLCLHYASMFCIYGRRQAGTGAGREGE